MSAQTIDARASDICIRFTGSIAALDEISKRVLFDRVSTPGDDVQRRTATILRDVQERGDVALRQMAAEYDSVQLGAIAVDMEECARALRELDPALRRSFERARKNITTAHQAFTPASSEVETEAGILVGRRPDPFALAGVYAPGGRAKYPSSLLMGAVAARVAGVDRVIVCSPPQQDGLPSREVLAAAALAGVDSVFAVGGAGAIAAMAFGTATIPAVDVIVGPGNAYVAEAKAQLSRTVVVDSPAGPSELLIIADATATPRIIAREVLAQAEHDPRAAVVVLCVGDGVCDNIAQTLENLLKNEPRAAIIAESLASNGAMLNARGFDETVEFANRYAPEHLMLAVAPEVEAELLKRVRNAGTVFLGQQSSVAFGDYMTGANHVLPTGGFARLRSGLSPLDFLRWTTWQRVSPRAAASLAEDVAIFADAEGLYAHASAARQWRLTQ